MKTTTVKDLTIKLDWKFQIVERLGRIHLNELMAFHRQSQAHFEAAMKAWHAETDGLSGEQESMRADDFLEQRDSIGSMLDRGHTLGIVGLYTVLERFLNLVIEHLRVGGAPIEESARGFNIHELRDRLSQYAKINMNRSPYDWAAIEQLREIRNCIVHTDGWINDEFATRLRAAGLKAPIDTRLQLPTTYFRRAWNLVNETCQRVHAECWNSFGYAKQHELWLRPKRTFTSDELRQVLREASEAGVVARERATKQFLRAAKSTGCVNEDSCGWAWLELDPKLLKHIHKLDIPNITTSYNATAIVEDFKLHLKDVEHYQRMAASPRGMEGAAKVLKKHGINCRVGSMAD